MPIKWHIVLLCLSVQTGFYSFRPTEFYWAEHDRAFYQSFRKNNQTWEVPWHPVHSSAEFPGSAQWFSQYRFDCNWYAPFDVKRSRDLSQNRWSGRQTH